MHDAIVLGFERRVARFLDWETVHICPKCDAWPITSSVEQTNYARLSHTRGNFHAHGSQSLSNQLGSLVLYKG
jgi:hypothetical protein